MAEMVEHNNQGPKSKNKPLHIAGKVLMIVGVIVGGVNQLFIGLLPLMIAGLVLWGLGMICFYIGMTPKERKAELVAMQGGMKGGTTPKRLLCIVLIMAAIIVGVFALMAIAFK